MQNVTAAGDDIVRIHDTNAFGGKVRSEHLLLISKAPTLGKISAETKLPRPQFYNLRLCNFVALLVWFGKTD